MESKFEEALQCGKYYEYTQLVKSQLFKKKMRGKGSELKEISKYTNLSQTKYCHMFLTLDL